MIKSAFIAKTLLLSPSEEQRSKESLFYKNHFEEKNSGDTASWIMASEPIYSQPSLNHKKHPHRKT